MFLFTAARPAAPRRVAFRRADDGLSPSKRRHIAAPLEAFTDCKRNCRHGLQPSPRRAPAATDINLRGPPAYGLRQQAAGLHTDGRFILNQKIRALSNIFGLAVAV